MQHTIKTYKDGFVDIPYCVLCGKEGIELNSECPGKIVDFAEYIEVKPIDKKTEQK